MKSAWQTVCCPKIACKNLHSTRTLTLEHVWPAEDTHKKLSKTHWHTDTFPQSPSNPPFKCLHGSISLQQFLKPSYSPQPRIKVTQNTPKFVSLLPLSSLILPFDPQICMQLQSCWLRQVLEISHWSESTSSTYCRTWDPWLRLPAVEPRLTQDLQESLADDLGVTSWRPRSH